MVATAPLLVRQTRSNYHHNRNRRDDLLAGKEREAGELEDDDDENASCQPSFRTSVLCSKF